MTFVSWSENSVPVADCNCKKNVTKKWKSHVKTVLRMSTSSVCSPLVVCWHNLDRRLNCLGDLKTVQLRFSLQKPREGGGSGGVGGFPMGFPVDGCQAKHQRLNVFSHFCFLKAPRWECFLSRPDSDWKDTEPVSVAKVFWVLNRGAVTNQF